MSRNDEQQLLPGELDVSGLGSRWAVTCAAIGLLGILASLLLAASTEHGREIFFHSYLHNFAFVLSLALGGLFFVLVTYLTRAGWSIALRRIAEVVASSVLPLAFLALVIVAGIHELYEWSHADAVAHDALLEAKSPWLNPTFFVIRLVFYFAVWNILALVFLRRSRTQDRTGDAGITLQLERFAAPGTIFYAMTVTFAAFDLLMSLYPHWYSTIYGVYFFAGSIVGFFSLVPILVSALQRSGKLTTALTAEHFHDMGKLMFAFVVFWAYIAFSQYFLIWYGNVPEETAWYLTRQSGPWTKISVLLLVGHFVLPFFWLMSRHPKRRGATLVLAALWLLAMHWLDLFYLVMPESRPDGPLFRLLDFTCLVGLLGIFLAFVFWRLRHGNLIPVKDPRLAESLGFENA